MTGTARELLNFFEKYYGEKYSGDVLDAMLGYLDGYSDAFYKAAAEVMIRRFSRCYGKAPCPADIERHMDEIMNSMPRPPSVPAPEPVITDEDRAAGLEFVGEIMALLRAKRNAPLAGPLAGAMSGWGGR